MKLKFANNILIIFLIFGIQNIIYSQSNKSLKKMGKVITEKEFKHLISKKDYYLAHKHIVNFFNAKSIYSFEDDNTVVQTMDNNFIIYSSNEFYELMEKPKNDMLKIDFLPKIESEASKLGGILNIPSDSLNNSLNSIGIIDRKIRSIGGLSEINELEIFSPMVCYCGEVVRKITNGKWELRQTNGDIAKLVIVASDGKYFNVFGIIDKIFVNAEDEFSFEGAISFELNPWSFQIHGNGIAPISDK